MSFIFKFLKIVKLKIFIYFMKKVKSEKQIIEELFTITSGIDEALNFVKQAIEKLQIN